MKNKNIYQISYDDTKCPLWVQDEGDVVTYLSVVMNTTTYEATKIIDIFNTDPYASKNYGLFGYVDICKHNGIFSAIEYMQEVLLHSLNHRDISDEDKAALRFESDLLEDYYNTVLSYCGENDIMTAEEIDCTTMCDVLANF